MRHFLCGSLLLRFVLPLEAQKHWRKTQTCRTEPSDAPSADSGRSTRPPRDLDERHIHAA